MANKTVAEALIKGQQFEDDDKFEQAYECYKYAHEADKNDADVLQRLGVCALTLNLNEDAIYYWNYFMALKPEDPISYTQLLDLYFHDDKYQYYLTRAKLKTIEARLPQAADDYKKAINNTTDDKEIITARYLLAQTYEIINKPMQAIDEYLKILDSEHNEGVYLSLANLYYSEDKSAALSVLMRAVEEYPESEEFKELLCKIYLSLGDYQNAQKFAVNAFDQAKALLMQDKNDEAFEVLTKVSEKDRSNARYSALLAEYYYNMDDYDRTLEYIIVFEKSNPESPLSSQMRALVYEKQNKDYETHLNWGKYYIKKNDLALALDEYLNAYNSSPKNPEIIKELINLYTSMDDKFASAEFCEKLVHIEKDDSATLKKLVKFYEEQGYEDKVIEYLDCLCEINPRDYEINFKLAGHAEKSGRRDDAIEYYQKYLKYAPSSDEKERVRIKADALINGEVSQEEGFLDKLLGFFSKK